MGGAFLLLVVVFIVTAYDGSIGRIGSSELNVKAMELSELLKSRTNPALGINNIVEEDESFIYEVSLKSLVLEDRHKDGVVTPGCSFSGGTYAVISKKTASLSIGYMLRLWTANLVMNSLLQQGGRTDHGTFF